LPTLPIDADGKPLNPEEAMQAGFYGKAMGSGDAISSSVQINYTASRTDAAKSGNETEDLSLHITENTFVSPAQIGAGAPNMTQVEVSWPGPTSISTNAATSLLETTPPIPAPANATSPPSSNSPVNGVPVLP
jgi:hypothetical protein